MKLIFVKKRTFITTKTVFSSNDLKKVSIVSIFGIDVYKSEEFESQFKINNSSVPKHPNPPMPPNKITENNEPNPLDMTKGFYPKNLKTNKDNLLCFSKENQRLKP